ncbi:MAG: DUF3021 domain-containing protein [Lachnospiraceae bacterium]|nr:DUF3021 domain-containing protein [Lachnospiraceae bacterium]
MRDFINDFLKWFLIINTGVMVVVGINLLGYDQITTLIIPQILACSFLTSLVTTAFFAYNPKKAITVPVRILLTCVHFLALCIIIMTLGVWFDWFSLTKGGVLLVVLSVAGVYFITAVISYILSRGEAREMTNALKNYREDNE